MKAELADELQISNDGLLYAGGRIIFDRQSPGSVDGNTALAASTTYWILLGRMPTPGMLESVTIRTAAAGVAGATIDLYKVPSGTALAAGTSLITQIAGNTPTADTDYNCTVTAANRSLAKGDMIAMKIVSGVGETLKPLSVQVVARP